MSRLGWIALALVCGCAEAGGVRGTYQPAGDSELIGDFPDFGGRCVGRRLATGPARIVWSCPACQFVVVEE